MSTGVYSALIVGCGNIGGGFDQARPDWADSALTHAGAYSHHPGFHLQACVDPDAQRRQSFADFWSVPEAHEDMSTLLEQGMRFDVVSICSPTALHEAHLLAALGCSPRVIFCEKPLAPSLEASQRMIKACEKQGVTLLANYSRRWDPSVNTFFNAIRSGQHGAIRSVVGYYNKGILNNGVHMIDLLRRLLGDLVIERVYLPAQELEASDPTPAVMLRSDDGRVPVLLTPGMAQDYALFELELICQAATVRMRRGGLDWQVRQAVASRTFAGYRHLEQEAVHQGEYGQCMHQAIAEIHAILSQACTPTFSAWDAFETQKMCQQILDRLHLNDITTQKAITS